MTAYTDDASSSDQQTGSAALSPDDDCAHRGVVTVFLSSPSGVMQKHRDCVAKAIARMKMHPMRMEDFSASADTPAKVCRCMIRDSTYFVGFVGKEYGSIVPDLEVSYSEMEYNTALELRRRPLMFVDEALRDFVDGVADPRHRGFIQRVKASEVGFYTDARDLATKVATDLHCEMENDRRRAGASSPFTIPVGRGQPQVMTAEAQEFRRRIMTALVSDSYDPLLCRLDPSERLERGRVIVHSVDDKTYPDPELPNHIGISGWFRVDLFDVYDNGVKVLLGGESGLVDRNGFWDIGKAEGRRPLYFGHNIWTVGVIPYTVITGFRLDGDEWYGEPHLYCRFAFNGEPYESIEYYANVKGFLRLDQNMRRTLD